MPHRGIERPHFYNAIDDRANAGAHSPETENPEQEFEPDSDQTMLLPVADVANQVELSAVRIRALLKAGKVTGEMRREGRGLGKWYTSVYAVNEYIENLWTPQEWGKKGGLIGGRGHKKEL
jgi:hypothetical protein